MISRTVPLTAQMLVVHNGRLQRVTWPAGDLTAADGVLGQASHAGLVVGSTRASAAPVDYASQGSLKRARADGIPEAALLCLEWKRRRSASTPPQLCVSPDSISAASQQGEHCSPASDASNCRPDVEAHAPAEGVNGTLYAVRAATNRRSYQEDAHVVAPVNPGMQPPLGLFCIFDGHGGSGVSSFCASNVTRHVTSHASCILGPSGITSDKAGTDILTASFISLDEELNRKSDKGLSEGGSTALAVLLDNTRIWAGWAGDSRAVLARAGTAVQLTDDHKPERADEAARIRSAGGQIFWNNGCRVMGVLSMSRAIGDAYLRKYGVVPNPEVTCTNRTDEDEFIILASDGLWSVISNQEAVDITRLSLERASMKGADKVAAARVATKVLVRAAMQRGSHDNITVIVVDLTSKQGTNDSATIENKVPANGQHIALQRSNSLPLGINAGFELVGTRQQPPFDSMHMLQYSLSGREALQSAERLLVSVQPL